VKIKFIGAQEGGMDKLKGKKIVNLHMDSAGGKETIPILDAQAKKYGFEVIHISVPMPGSEQQARRSHEMKAQPANPSATVRDVEHVREPPGISDAAPYDGAREAVKPERGFDSLRRSWRVRASRRPRVSPS
jgi:hypothetical protein